MRTYQEFISEADKMKKWWVKRDYTHFTDRKDKLRKPVSHLN